MYNLSYYNENDWLLHEFKDCAVDVTGIGNGLVRLIIHRKKIVKSRFMKKKVEINSMLTIIMGGINKPEYNRFNKRTVMNFTLAPKHKTKYMNYRFWHEGRTNGTLEDLYTRINNARFKNEIGSNGGINIVEIDIVKFNKKFSSIPSKMIPVIYQVASDTKKNYLREIHCHDQENGLYEVSLLFNDEKLRKYRIFDRPYRIYRRLKYGRTKDIETFKITTIGKWAEGFIFENIFSGNHDISYDTIHGDQAPAPERKVEMYFNNMLHPIVFVNTANHALAPFDNNQAEWKWEYVGWYPNAPIKTGSLSRKELEDLH